MYDSSVMPKEGRGREPVGVRRQIISPPSFYYWGTQSVSVREATNGVYIQCFSTADSLLKEYSII